MEGYRGKPEEPVCLVCGEEPGGDWADPRRPCRRAAGCLTGSGATTEEPIDLGTITTGTRFIDFLADSLEYVEWLIEAEEYLGVVIPDRDAERMTTVGDFIRYVHLHARKKLGEWTPRSIDGSDAMGSRKWTVDKL